MLFLFPVSSAVWNAISWDKNKHNLAAVNIETLTCDDFYLKYLISFSRREHLDWSHFNFYHSYQIDAVQAELVHQEQQWSSSIQFFKIFYFWPLLHSAVKVTGGGGRHVAKGCMSDLNHGWLLSTCSTFIVMEYFYLEVLLLHGIHLHGWLSAQTHDCSTAWRRAVNRGNNTDCGLPGGGGACSDGQRCSRRRKRGLFVCECDEGLKRFCQVELRLFNVFFLNLFPHPSIHPSIQSISHPWLIHPSSINHYPSTHQSFIIIHPWCIHH